VKFYFGGITRNSGVENLKLDHGGFSGGGYNFLLQYCDSCWIKGVDSGRATGYNSSAKTENNIFNKDFPAIELNNSSSGFYIGYNYSYGTPSQSGTNMVTWTFDDGHAPFNIMNLYEGNIGEMWGMDGYFGGSGYGTVLRNYFTGFNPNYGVAGEAVQLLRLAYNYNLVGNVLGSTNQMRLRGWLRIKPTAYTGCSMYGSGTTSIYRLGYPNSGNCSLTPYDNFTPTGGYPDPKVTATLLRWGNYDYFNKATRFVTSEIPAGVTVPTDQVIPKSYAYASRPAWWPLHVCQLDRERQRGRLIGELIR
jgi:hypothetical protein